MILFTGESIQRFCILWNTQHKAISDPVKVSSRSLLIGLGLHILLTSGYSLCWSSHTKQLIKTINWKTLDYIHSLNMSSIISRMTLSLDEGESKAGRGFFLFIWRSLQNSLFLSKKLNGSACQVVLRRTGALWLASCSCCHFITISPRAEPKLCLSRSLHLNEDALFPSGLRACSFDTELERQPAVVEDMQKMQICVLPALLKHTLDHEGKC